MADQHLRDLAQLERVAAKEGGAVWSAYVRLATWITGKTWNETREMLDAIHTQRIAKEETQP